MFSFLVPKLLKACAGFQRGCRRPVVTPNSRRSIVTSGLRTLIKLFVGQHLGGSILASLPSGFRGILAIGLRNRRHGLCTTRRRQLHTALAGAGSTSFGAGGVQVLTRFALLHRVYYSPELICTSTGGTSTGLSTVYRLMSAYVSRDGGILMFSRFASFLSLVNAHLTRRNISFCAVANRAPGGHHIRLISRFGNGSIPIFLVSLGTNGAKLGLINTSMIIRTSP